MHTKEQEKIGEILLLFDVIIFSLFPILINYTSKLIPPILFAGLSNVLAGLTMFIYSLATGKFKEFQNRKALKYSLMVTVFIIIIPSIFIYPGTKLTSGVNTTIFFQVETFAALFFCALFLKEKITKIKLIGATLISLGAVVVLYNGDFSLNVGDLLIIIGTVIYPIGNIFAKKGLNEVSPQIIICIRSAVGGVALILISLIFEKTFGHISGNINKVLPYILINGIIIMGLSKILWYEGLKRMEISKATALTMSYPALSLIFGYFLLKEVPSPYQFSGLILVIAGVITITRFSRKRQNPDILQTSNTP